jgi:hypothetical protein
MVLRALCRVLALSASASSAMAQDCRVFQHRDYGGASWGLRAGEILAALRDPGINQTCSHANCTIYWRPDWNDHVSSFRVKKGCTITLWQHVDGSRIPPRGYGAYFRSNRSYRYVGSRWNDQASLVQCRCR